MSWLAAGMMAVGAVAGNENAKEGERQQAQAQEMNAIETQYSNWINPQYRQVPQAGSRMGSILGGAASGAMTGMSMGNMGGAATKMAPGGLDPAAAKAADATMGVGAGAGTYTKSGSDFGGGSQWGRPQGSGIKKPLNTFTGGSGYGGY